MNEQEQYAAAIQRQRTLLFYKACTQGRIEISRVNLRDGSRVEAKEVVAVDSSESKLVLSGLQTDWGTSARPVTIRGSDIATVEFNGS